MKCTKRIAAMVLALLLTLGLTACGKNPAAEGVPAGDWTWADRYEGTFSDQGYYFAKDYDYLYYLDTSSGITTALCTKAGCLHNQENCEAYFSGLSGLFFRLGGSCFWDGNLYYIDQNGYSFELYRCNATGTERDVIGTLGTKYIEEQLSVSLYKYAQVGHYWYYYATADGSVWNEEQEKWTSKMVVNYISRIDLRTGKEEILIEDRENSLDLCAVQENAVLYTSRGIPAADMRDPEYREQLKKLPVTLYCWNAESEQTSKLFEKGDGNFGKITVVVGEKLYYVLSEQKEDGGYLSSTYVYDLKTGKDTLFAENEAMLYYGGEYVRRQDPETKEAYLFGLESGKRIPIQVSNGYPRMECWTDRGCIVEWYMLPAGAAEKENRLCYVTYEAMVDGLQDEDMMVLYSYKNTTSAE